MTEIECPYCRGRGYVMEAQVVHTCYNCFGQGRMPNDQKKLLKTSKKEKKQHNGDQEQVEVYEIKSNGKKVRKIRIL
ncbi:MAG: hypothetical protein K6T54_07060 [Ignavibacterium sp.]|nr:hypothetical protein [Ignavibacterium sp.]